MSVVIASSYWYNIAFDSYKVSFESRQIMDAYPQTNHTKESFPIDITCLYSHIRNLNISSAFQTIYLTVIAIPELIHLATQGKISVSRIQQRTGGIASRLSEILRN